MTTTGRPTSNWIASPIIGIVCSGAMIVCHTSWTTGTFTQNTYGPANGWAQVSVTDTSDGTTRMLWNSTAGAASIWDAATAVCAYPAATAAP
ncbi:MAG: hypothetical protein ACLQVD_08050 [Capsulimonadaceae bacterium]